MRLVYELTTQRTSFSPILERNLVAGHSIDLDAPQSELTSEIVNPYLPVNAPNLVRLMFHLHRKKRLSPHRNYVSYLREAKKLIDEVGTDEAECLMLKAAEFSANPWGFAFLNRLKSRERHCEKV